MMQLNASSLLGSYGHSTNVSYLRTFRKSLRWGGTHINKLQYLVKRAEIEQV